MGAALGSTFMPFNLRSLRQLIVGSNKTPKVTAASLGVGVALAFSPLVGLHLLLAIVITRVFKLNGLVLLAGTLVHNPWTMLPIHALGLITGDFLLDGSLNTFELARSMPWGDMEISKLWDLDFWARNRSFIHHMIGPFALGSTFWSLIMGGFAYLVSFRFLSAIHRKKKALAKA